MPFALPGDRPAPTSLIAQTGDPLSSSYYLIVSALLSLFALVAIQRRQTLARGLTPAAAN